MQSFTLFSSLLIFAPVVGTVVAGAMVTLYRFKQRC